MVLEAFEHKAFLEQHLAAVLSWTSPKRKHSKPDVLTTKDVSMHAGEKVAWHGIKADETVFLRVQSLDEWGRGVRRNLFGVRGQLMQ